MPSERACMSPPSIWLGKLSCKGIFGKEMAKHLPYISLLSLIFAFKQLPHLPDWQQHSLLILGEPHGYTSCYGRMGSNTHQNSLFVPAQRLYLAGSPRAWTKRSCSMLQLSPQLAHWWNWPQSLFWLQGNLSQKSVFFLHLFYTTHPQ